MYPAPATSKIHDRYKYLAQLARGLLHLGFREIAASVAAFGKCVDPDKNVPDLRCGSKFLLAPPNNQTQRLLLFLRVQRLDAMQMDVN